MGIQARVNRRKELAQWLMAEIHQRNGCGKFLDQVIRFVIILPASVLFCLTLLGCDSQEDTAESFQQAVKDVSFVQHELFCWIFSNVRAKWTTVRKLSLLTDSGGRGGLGIIQIRCVCER